MDQYDDYSFQNLKDDLLSKKLIKIPKENVFCYLIFKLCPFPQLLKYYINVQFHIIEQTVL